MSIPEGIRTQSKIGCYDLEKVIGKGNFAVVRLATHVPTKMKVAIKIIDMSRLDVENRKKVKREVEVMKQLDHPNIIKLYQVMQASQWLYLVMEYASGGEIFEYLIQHRRMSEAEARKKFRQIVMAVDYCHLKGVVHRDLKAENLLLDESSNVKLADFGFSNTFAQSEMLKTWCGSPPYAAPELFEGKEYSGPQADIWSLGVVLYVMVCGALPFDGNNLQHLRARVLAGRFRIPYYMSTECEKLIRRMLQLDPAKRIPLSKVLEHRWMQEGEDGSTARTALAQNHQRNSSSNLLLNDKVMLAIQRLNFNTELVKEAVEKKLYNEFSALYYLLLHKCEKGQLHIAPPMMPSLPHHRYSLPAAIPLISIDGAESQSSGIELPRMPNPWPMINMSAPSNGSANSVVDPNLARYLNQGRRHTLGPEQHFTLMLQEDMLKLRKINESSSSQASSGFGSSGTNPPVHPEPSFVPSLEISADQSLQNSINSLSSSSRPNNLHIRSAQRSFRRRASDGGPYAAMFKLMNEKRQHMQVQGLDGGASTAAGPAAVGATPNPIKLLLQEKSETVHRKNTLPVLTHKQWLQWKNQPNALHQLWSAKSGVNAMPQPFTHAGMAGLNNSGVSLQKQLQPFQDYSPQQIQEQLQHLHLQRKENFVSEMADMEFTEQKESPPITSIASSIGSSSVSTSGIGSGGDQSSSSSLSSTTTSQSRKSSGSSLLQQYLLSPPTPPSNPVSISMQSQSIGTSSAMYTNELSGPRRYSVQATPAVPTSYSPKQRTQRNTLPDLFSTRSRMSGLSAIELPSQQHSQTLPGIPPSPRSPQPDGFSSGSSPENSLIFQQLMSAENQSPPKYTHMLHRQNSPKRLTPSPTLGMEGKRSPSPNTLQKRRRPGVSLTHHEQAEVTATIDQFPGTSPHNMLPFMSVSHPPILLNSLPTSNPTSVSQQSVPSSFQPVQNIPIYFNQNISFLNPQVANQIAQQQVSLLASHISSVLNKFQLAHECTNNVFTVSHQGVELQIRVGGTPHNILQNALQLNLQYMHISGDPQLYQALCAQLAPHFIPSMQK